MFVLIQFLICPLRCGHCKKLKPEFDKASKDLLANDPPVTLAKIDCTEVGKDTCNRFEVRGYPTLKIFRGGELSQDYNGPRDAGGIVKYMKSQVRHCLCYQFPCFKPFFSNSISLSD